MNCRMWKDTFAPAPAALEEAQQFLRQGKPIPLEARKMWAGKVHFSEKATIPHVNEAGLALAYDGDGGWGSLVRTGKHTDGSFSAELVEASAGLIEREWARVLVQKPWITAVPSLRHPQLVPDFARQLAARLRLPYAEAVRCAQTAPQQRLMRNSYQQLANIEYAFEVNPVTQHGPVILVDDMVDSGWTLTVIGWLLREAGVPAVFPFVLAKATGSE